MAQTPQLTAPVMGSGTGLHRYDTAWLRCEELDQLLARDATAEHGRTRRISAVRMKDLLCDIQADGGNFFHGRLPLKR
jgi:hypothetical protein